jgi:hypothetical protein
MRGMLAFAGPAIAEIGEMKNAVEERPNTIRTRP